MDEWLQISFGTVERAEQAIRAVEKETGEDHKKTFLKLTQWSKARKEQARIIKAHANETMFLDQMFLQANTLGHWLEESAAWTLLCRSADNRFRTLRAGLLAYRYHHLEPYQRP